MLIKINENFSINPDKVVVVIDQGENGCRVIFDCEYSINFDKSKEEIVKIINGKGKSL